MTTENFIIENLKCGGCANTIRKGISEMVGVEKVEIHVEQSRVEVQGSFATTTRDQIAEKLKKMGYPEEGNGTTLDKAKSYVSCAIGKFS
jgi:copper chaperone